MSAFAIRRPLIKGEATRCTSSILQFDMQISGEYRNCAVSYVGLALPGRVGRSGTFAVFPGNSNCGTARSANGPLRGRAYQAAVAGFAGCGGQADACRQAPNGGGVIEYSVSRSTAS